MYTYIYIYIYVINYVYNILYVHVYIYIYRSLFLKHFLCLGLLSPSLSRSERSVDVPVLHTARDKFHGAKV